jgi:hypothetical protein
VNPFTFCSRKEICGGRLPIEVFGKAFHIDAHFHRCYRNDRKSTRVRKVEVQIWVIGQDRLAVAAVSYGQTLCQFACIKGQDTSQCRVDADVIAAM